MSDTSTDADLRRFATEQSQRYQDQGQLIDAARAVHLLLLDLHRDARFGEWSLARRGDDLTYRGPLGPTVAGRLGDRHRFAAEVLPAGTPAEERVVAELARWVRPGEALSVSIPADKGGPFVSVSLLFEDAKHLKFRAEMRITDDTVLAPASFAAEHMTALRLLVEVLKELRYQVDQASAG